MTNSTHPIPTPKAHKLARLPLLRCKELTKSKFKISQWQCLMPKHAYGIWEIYSLLFPWELRVHPASWWEPFVVLFLGVKLSLPCPSAYPHGQEKHQPAALLPPAHPYWLLIVLKGWSQGTPGCGWCQNCMSKCLRTVCPLTVFNSFVQCHFKSSNASVDGREDNNHRASIRSIY